MQPNQSNQTCQSIYHISYYTCLLSLAAHISVNTYYTKSDESINKNLSNSILLMNHCCNMRCLLVGQWLQSKPIIEPYGYITYVDLLGRPYFVEMGSLPILQFIHEQTVIRMAIPFEYDWEPTWNIGDACLARCPEYGFKWARAQVRSVHPTKNKLTVSVHTSHLKIFNIFAYLIVQYICILDRPKIRWTDFGFIGNVRTCDAQVANICGDIPALARRHRITHTLPTTHDGRMSTEAKQRIAQIIGKAPVYLVGVQKRENEEEDTAMEVRANGIDVYRTLASEGHVTILPNDRARFVL